jgi:hypothetical protein
MNTKLEAVREAIIRAIPEIVELKFGCLVDVPARGGSSVRDYYRRDIVVSNRTTDPTKEVGIAKRLDPIKYICLASGQEFADFQLKILGRPITLEDVLRATESWWATMIYTSSESHHKPRPSEGVRLYQIVRKWTLGLPLDQQPQPVINFLHSLLANTEMV